MTRTVSAGMLVLGLAAPATSWAGTGAAAQDSRTLQFRNEVQNLRLGELALQPKLANPVALDCSAARGPVGFGELPHRLAGESYASTEHFIAFAAVYPPGEKPILFVDLGADRRLSCQERLDPIPNPKDSSRWFRTLKVEWHDGGSVRSRMYRINIPSRLEGGGFSIDLVDLPVAHWQADGHDSRWILLDGNHDGVYDRKFGDAVLVDPTGHGFVDLTPKGKNLFSFHAPLELPWGTFEISEIDSAGRFVKLHGVDSAQVERFRALAVGDVVPPTSCRAHDGSTATIGGRSQGPQIVYFWLSHCGSCRAAMNVLTPLARELASQGVRAVGVSLDESEESFHTFVAERMLDWPQCFSGKMLTDNELARRFGVLEPSEIVLIGPDGRIASKLEDASTVRAELIRLGWVPSARAGL